MPDTLHPYPFSGPNASLSSQDAESASLRGEASVQPQSHQLRRLPHNNLSGDFGRRNHSNSRIDHPTVSGHIHGPHGDSAQRLSVSRPTSVHGHTSASRPTSFHGQLATSRPTSFYADKSGSASQISIVPPSITIEGRDQDADGFDAAPMQASPIQDEISFQLPVEASDQETNKLKEAYPKFRPIAPEEVPRYKRDAYVAEEYTELALQPLTTRFETNVIPVGWTQLLHPEGARYFVYENKRVYTDADILNESTRRFIMTSMNELDDFVRAQGIQLSSKVDLVLNPHSEGDDLRCDYYLVDHETRSVFWLDTFQASWLPIWDELQGVTALSHIQHAIVSQYWYHCHLYPHSYKLTIEVVDELRDILMHSICDTITSSTSTVPYSANDLNDMMQLLNNMRRNPGTGGGVSAFGRIMHIFAQQRFLNFHGQPAARLDRDRSVHHEAGYVKQRSWLMRCLSPALFSSPDLYYRQLTKIWVDGLVHEASWANFISKMSDEWQELILFNTVLLNANVGFLAIQSVDNSSESPGRSPKQIASFLSIVASIGSIILGLVLARKHRAKARDTARDAAQFLNSWVRDDRLGLETLAILYSVPYALLMWGVLFFLGAFSFMCYSSSDTLVRSIMSGAWFIVAVLVLWCATALATWDHRRDGRKTFWGHVFKLFSLILFGLWWTVDEIVNRTGQGLKQGLGLLRPKPKVEGAQQEESPPVEMNPVRRSSTTVVELWRKSSLFGRPEKKTTADTEATAVAEV